MNAPPAASQSEAGESVQSSFRSTLRWTSPTLLAGFIVLVGFSIFIYFMIGHIAAEEREWNRLAYLYGSVEAIVFAAAGAIFGTQVQRSQTENAEARAKDSEQKADMNADDAVKGKVLSSAVKSMSRSGRTSGGTLGSQRAGPAAPATQSDLDRLAAIADSLFPD
jgi:hypothetical protein